MVISQALEPAVVHAIVASDPDRRRVSRVMSLAIAGSVAAHLALGFYLYEAKYGVIAPPTPPDRIIQTPFMPNVIVHPPKPTRPPPPNVLRPRASTHLIAVNTSTLPLQPQLAKLAPISQPPRIAPFTPLAQT